MHDKTNTKQKKNVKTKQTNKITVFKIKKETTQQLLQRMQAPENTEKGVLLMPLIG